MSTYASLPVINEDPVNAVRGLLTRLLETGIVSAVLVPVETRDGCSVQPALVRQADGLARANPFLPLMPISMARMVSLLTRHVQSSENGASPSKPIAVVMRPCELRSAVELAKLRQIAFDQLLTIGIDCVGTFEAVDIQNEEDARTTLVETLSVATEGRAESPDGLSYRHACSICTNPSVWQADISLHTIGVDTRNEILVEVADDALLGILELLPGADPTSHHIAIESLVAERQEYRNAELDLMHGQLQAREDGTPGLLAEFESCQRCHNCTVACPICYCKECLFRTNTFEHETHHYMDTATRKGVMRLPGDTITFHLTRLAHVSLSCVGCGLCTSACPADLPVDSLFQTVAQQTQKLFDYVPGRNLDEPLPLVTFETEEFQTLGEREAT